MSAGTLARVVRSGADPLYLLGWMEEREERYGSDLRGEKEGEERVGS